MRTFILPLCSWTLLYLVVPSVAVAGISSSPCSGPTMSSSTPPEHHDSTYSGILLASAKRSKIGQSCIPPFALSVLSYTDYLLFIRRGKKKGESTWSVPFHHHKKKGLSLCRTINSSNRAHELRPWSSLQNMSLLVTLQPFFLWLRAVSMLRCPVPSHSHHWT